MHKRILQFITTYQWFILAIIVIVGMYLRFYNIQYAINFNWDQGRDAQTVYDILHGQFHLLGPRTGAGHMHLGPLYYYLMAPFFFVFHYDPMAANYFNMVMNLFNFAAIYIISRKLFGAPTALFASFVYAINNYLIELMQTPWNVTPMIGLGLIIFYLLYKVYDEKKYVNIIWAWFLAGLYFHVHFTAVFLPPIIIGSLLLVPEKKKAILYSLVGAVAGALWLIPNVIYELTNKDSDISRYDEFSKTFLIGFHAQFFLFRLPYALIQVKKVIAVPALDVLKYVIPPVYAALLIFFDKDKKDRLLGYLMMWWFIVPLFAFSIYGGSVSEYYYLYQFILVCYIIAYLYRRLYAIVPYKTLTMVVALLLLFGYGFFTSYRYWVKPTKGGLDSQKKQAFVHVQEGTPIPYTEGDIEAYLYTIMTKDKSLLK